MWIVKPVNWAAPEAAQNPTSQALHTVGIDQTQQYVVDEYDSRLASAVLAPCKRVSSHTKATTVRLYHCAD